MKRRLFRLISLSLGTLAFLGVFYGLAFSNTPNTDAVKATDFNAGRIIDDAIFYNANSMTVEEIQKFMDEHLPVCDMWGTGSSAGRVVKETGYVMPAGSTNADYARKRMAAGNTKYHEPPYVCLNKYYENPTTHETLYETNGIVKEGMLSAAQIIYDESQKYNINPQVLLVLIKKESVVWGDNWPLKWEYNAITGYGCPDTAPCNESYYGFYNQIHMAAYQFNRYKERNSEFNYHPGMVNTIAYSPNINCGVKQVYIENMATASLYIYTPYTPNSATLVNYPGEADCGSYGNRNFFMFFNQWFGSTYIESYSDLETPRYFEITKDTIRINPYNGNSAEQSAIKAGTILKLTSKTKVYGEWCFRTEHNTQNNIDACIPAENISEISLEETEKPNNYVIIPENAQNYLINADDIYKKNAVFKIANLTKSVTFRDKTYLIDPDIVSSNSKIIYGYLEEDVIKLDGYEEKDVYLRAKNETTKVPLTEEQNLEEKNRTNIPLGTARLFKKKITLNDKDYYQTEFDYKNNILAFIDGENLESECSYVDFEKPRAMKLMTKVDRISPLSGERFDTLEAGRVIEFSTKVLINNEWYYRTKYNTEHNQDYVIPAKYITEV